MFDLQRAQSYMGENGIDAWLVYDFRGSNPVMWQLLGWRKPTTRRCFMLVPRQGEPKLLVHAVDREPFSDAKFATKLFVSHQDMHAWLKENLSGRERVAMEYSPLGAIPIMSWVDGGTLDLVRSLGVEVVSSANVFQVAVAAWDWAGLESHLSACREVAEVKDIAFEFIRRAIREGGTPTEYDVQQCIVREFENRNMETQEAAIVAVNQNSRNPHYWPTQERNSPIRHGDWVLIDLWARHPGERNVFADITWVGYVGDRVPSRFQGVFDVVKTARDLVVARVAEAWRKGERLQGWQLDAVAREYIARAGYGQYFSHRTGHSLGPGPTLHALGVNLDDLETHDTRDVLPGIGFSVEPGIYLRDFGVRLEINVYIDPAEGPKVTTAPQDEIVLLA